MKENKNYIKHYNSVSQEVKYISNSLIRLKILAALYEKPRNMKELTRSTRLTYSSISGILHNLELKDMIYLQHNKYHLMNSLKIQMRNVLEIKEIVNLLEDIFNIIEGHIIDKIPEKSVNEMHLLSNAKLLEADEFNNDKITKFIENALAQANCAYCIFPVYHDGFNEQINELVKNDKFVEVIVSKNLLNVYKKRSKVKYLSSFKGRNNFLLIVTDKIMIFGLFRKEGIFDRNRILTSPTHDALEWGNNLFRYFKNNR